ncbi:DUF2273 domain-containing protein [Nocardioidaceae bacterium]|nr:DUF2273 domain-containing protein [Nocardioidaceae bacterium]
MSLPVAGLLSGLALALLITLGGFTGLLLGIVLGAGGYLAGAQASGEIDLRELRRGRR